MFSVRECVCNEAEGQDTVPPLPPGKTSQGGTPPPNNAWQDRYGGARGEPPTGRLFSRTASLSGATYLVTMVSVCMYVGR